MQPSLKQLKYLLAVAEQRNFGRAAKACFVTQSTLSAGIQALEETLGIIVFERDNKQVLVTEAGAGIIERARKILAEVNDLVAFSQHPGTPLGGKLVLGVIPTIGPFLLPSLLTELRSEFPQAKIYLREQQTSQLLEELASGRIDAALMALPFPMSGMTSIHLFDDPFYFATTHPPNGAVTMTIKDLEGCELLLLEEGHCLRQHALAACKLDSAKYGIPYQGTSLHTIVQMVANNLGVTLLPEMAIKSGILNNSEVTAIPFLEKNSARSIGLVWRASSSKSDDLQLLAKFIQQHH